MHQELVECLIGKTETEAKSAIMAMDLTMRVVERDGQSLPGTAEMNPRRVNVAIDNGVVVEIISLG